MCELKIKSSVFILMLTEVTNDQQLLPSLKENHQFCFGLLRKIHQDKKEDVECVKHILRSFL